MAEPARLTETFARRAVERAVGDRHAGYQAELAARGLRAHAVAAGDFSAESGRRAMAELLAAAPTLDAVFVASDLMALGALRTLAEAGKAVPDDVAVVGFDDSPLGATTEPALTTIRQPVVAMGTALARGLLKGIERGEPVAPVIMPTEVVLRGSA